MSKTLWLFLHTEGASARVLQWFVSDKIGEAISIIDTGEGEPHPQCAPLSALSAVLVLPSARVLLTEITLPPTIAPTDTALAYALEERLTQETSQVVIRRLFAPPSLHSSAANTNQAMHTHTVAVIDKPLFHALSAECARWSLVDWQLTADCLLLPIAPQSWSMWFSPTHCFARLSALSGMGLLSGGEALLFKNKWREAIERGTSINTLNVYTAKEHEQLAQQTIAEWALPMPIQVHRANVSVFMHEDIIDFTEKKWSDAWWPAKERTQALRPLLNPAFLLMASFLVVWILGAVLRWQEYQHLTQKINTNFYRIFQSDAIKSVEPLAQMEERHRQSQGQSRHDGLTSAFGALLQGSATTTIDSLPSLPQKFEWQNGRLRAQFATPPSPDFLTAVRSAMQKASPRSVVSGEGNAIILQNLP